MEEGERPGNKELGCYEYYQEQLTAVLLTLGKRPFPIEFTVLSAMTTKDRKILKPNITSPLKPAQ